MMKNEIKKQEGELNNWLLPLLDNPSSDQEGVRITDFVNGKHSNSFANCIKKEAEEWAKRPKFKKVENGDITEISAWAIINTHNRFATKLNYNHPQNYMATLNPVTLKLCDLPIAGQKNNQAKGER